MASVKPFRGLRPAAEVVEKVVSLPYDVMDTEEARLIIQGNPHSFLRVTRSEADLPETVAPDAPEVYEQAGRNLQEFLDKEWLRQDAAPCFYIYKQQMGNQIQVGLVAAASVEEYLDGRIKKHELTRNDKEEDRCRHIRATGAQTGAVFLTYRADDFIHALIAQCMNRKAAYDFTTDDGIRHTLFVVNEPDKIKAIEQAFKRVDALYIADGHHRSAAAANLYQHCKAANPNHTGEEPYNRFLAVMFPHNMLRIMDYNRVVEDLNGLTEADFLAKVQEHFDIAPCTRQKCNAEYPHYFGMYLNGAWYKLVAKPETYAGDDPVRRLDVSILQDYLLQPVLGIENPRTDKRINFVGGIRGMEALERMVDSGRYAVAFSMYPTSIKDLMTIADQGKIMPPKSTWFEPKLRDAMVVHLTPCAAAQE